MQAVTAAAVSCYEKGYRFSSQIFKPASACLLKAPISSNILTGLSVHILLSAFGMLVDDSDSPPIERDNRAALLEVISPSVTLRPDVWLPSRAAENLSPLREERSQS